MDGAAGGDVSAQGSGDAAGDRVVDRPADAHHDSGTEGGRDLLFGQPAWTDGSVSDGSGNDGPGPMDPPLVISMSVDTRDSLLVDDVSNSDSTAGPGDGTDGVFDVAVMGPFDGLILLTVADGVGGPLGNATMAWDTLVGDQAFPQAVSDKYQRGSDTPLLGVTVDGTHLVNQSDGTIAPFGPGMHQITIVANANGAFQTGQYFRLVVREGDSLSWGPPIEFSWGRPAIDRMTLESDSGLVDRVGQGDTATSPDGYNDGALDVEVDGPLDALILIAAVPYGPDYVWDTIIGARPFPQGVSVTTIYQHGSDTWVLGVADPSGTLLNSADGSLPRIDGHQSLKLFASDVDPPIFAPSTDGGSGQGIVFQVVGLIGDLTVWGPRLALP